jgi:hypothetical protein
MAAHKGPASSRPRCTRGRSSIAAMPIYHLSCAIDNDRVVMTVCWATRVDSRQRQTSYSVLTTHHCVIQSSDSGDTRGLIVNETKQFENILYCMGVDLKQHVHLIWLHYSLITFIVASVQTRFLLHPQSNFVRTCICMKRKIWYLV